MHIAEAWQRGFERSLDLVNPAVLQDHICVWIISWMLDYSQRRFSEQNSWCKEPSWLAEFATESLNLKLLWLVWGHSYCIIWNFSINKTFFKFNTFKCCILLNTLFDYYHIISNITPLKVLWYTHAVLWCIGRCAAVCVLKQNNLLWKISTLLLANWHSETTKQQL